MDQVDQSGSKCNQLMSSFELISLLWFIANLAAIRPQSVGLIDNIFLIHFSIFRERAAIYRRKCDERSYARQALLFTMFSHSDSSVCVHLLYARAKLLSVNWPISFHLEYIP